MTQIDEARFERVGEFIYDHAFEADAVLKIDGDFGSDDAKGRYVQMIADALNRAAAPAAEQAELRATRTFCNGSTKFDEARSEDWKNAELMREQWHDGLMTGIEAERRFPAVEPALVQAARKVCAELDALAAFNDIDQLDEDIHNAIAALRRVLGEQSTTGGHE